MLLWGLTEQQKIFHGLTAVQRISYKKIALYLHSPVFPAVLTVWLAGQAATNALDAWLSTHTKYTVESPANSWYCPICVWLHVATLHPDSALCGETPVGIRQTYNSLVKMMLTVNYYLWWGRWLQNWYSVTHENVTFYILKRAHPVLISRLLAQF